jgi:hypothetical protein
MDEFDYGELSAEWWLTTAKELGLSERQAKFAAAKHRGASNTQAAKEAGYGVDSKQIGYRVARTEAVSRLLAMAVAEAGGGYDGNLTTEEAKRILTLLARGSDPAMRIKSIEALERMQAREAAQAQERRELGFDEALKEAEAKAPTFGRLFLLEAYWAEHGALPVRSEEFRRQAQTIAVEAPASWWSWRCNSPGHEAEFDALVPLSSLRDMLLRQATDATGLVDEIALAEAPTETAH